MTDNTQCAQQWETTAVTPLPLGWINVYRSDNECHIWASPALLTQECTTQLVCWQEPDTNGETRYLKRTEPVERETRIVFADLDEFGDLRAAICASSYCGTVTEAEYARADKNDFQPIEL